MWKRHRDEPVRALPKEKKMSTWKLINYNGDLNVDLSYNEESNGWTLLVLDENGNAIIADSVSRANAAKVINQLRNLHVEVK